MNKECEKYENFVRKHLLEILIVLEEDESSYPNDFSNLNLYASYRDCCVHIRDTKDNQEIRISFECLDYCMGKLNYEA